MSWWGKAIGGVLGFMVGGPLGVLIGIGIGHNFDRGISLEGTTDTAGYGRGNRERIETIFFTTTFWVMGRIAKADGRVTADEIRLAEAVMQHMALTAEMQRAAINLFHEGKNEKLDLTEVIQQFRKEVGRNQNLLRAFLEIQLQAAYADGTLHPNEKKLLLHITQLLGISEQVYNQLESLVRAHMGAQSSRPSSKQALKASYDLLGVSEQSDDNEVKKAYQKLIRQHHPDKLVGRGMPEEMIQIATEKTQSIRKAYETIREHRKNNA